MRTTKAVWIWALAIGAAVTGLSNLTPKPLTTTDVAGTTWIGCSSDGLHYYRIALGHGRGSVAYLWAGGEPEVYRVNSWKLDAAGHLGFEAIPKAESVEPIWIESAPLVSRNTMSIKVRAFDDRKWEGWEHQLTIFRENVMEQRFRLLKEVMEKR